MAGRSTALEVAKAEEKLRLVYDLYRTALLNRKYYAYRLVYIRYIDRVMECTVAIGTSVAIATWATWKTPIGRYVWSIIGALCALVAVLKPVLQLPQLIESYSKLFVGYTDLYIDMRRIEGNVRSSQRLTAGLWREYDTAYSRFKELELKGDVRISRRLLDRCYKEVLREIPANSLWVPSEKVEAIEGSK